MNNLVLLDNIATSGAGLYGNDVSKLKLTEATFDSNFAIEKEGKNLGGGMYFSNSDSIKFSKCEISNGLAEINGGGGYFEDVKEILFD